MVDKVIVEDDNGEEIEIDAATDEVDEGTDEGAAGDKKVEAKADPDPATLDVSSKLKQDIKVERQKRRTAEAELRRLVAEGSTGEEKLRADAESAAETKWKSLIARSAVRVAIAEAGASQSAARLAKLVDIDALDVDDDGEVDGLDDAIASVKAEFPEMFGGGSKPKAAKLDAAAKLANVKKMSSAERIAATLTGGRG